MIRPEKRCPLPRRSFAAFASKCCLSKAWHSEAWILYLLDDSTKAKLQGTFLPRSSQRAWDSLQKQVPGLFVSWHTPQGLRGCMGTLQPIELHSGLSDYALTSALYDLRFSPITLKEVKGLTCRVSILHSFEPCSVLSLAALDIHELILANLLRIHWTGNWALTVSPLHLLPRFVAFALAAPADTLPHCFLK
eukprot:symbB.v1.2.011534.t1/scaffold778.1/size163404/17